jgi:hypothetical protein
VCVTDAGPAQGHLLDVTHHVTRFDAVADTEAIVEKDEESGDGKPGAGASRVIRPVG